MKKRSATYTILLGVILLLFCADRDNNFDPQSPLYHVYQPYFNATIDIDSLKIIKRQNDTIFAHLPTVLSISATPENQTDEITIYFQHILNNKKDNSIVLNGKLEMTLIDSGIHTFNFESITATGEPAKIKSIVIVTTPPEQPKIKYFKCDHDTLPILQDTKITFSSDITDFAAIAKTVIYMYPQGNQVSKEAPIPVNGQITLTENYTINAFASGTQEIKLKVIDHLGRTDSMSLNIVFTKDTPSCRGTPPVISVRCNADDNVAEEFQPILFILTALDTDGSIVKKHWSFDDYQEAFATDTIVHWYSHTGTYMVRVSAKDDSGCVTRDSLKITIIPNKNSPPEIDTFLVKPNSGQAPLTVNFYMSWHDKDLFTGNYKLKTGEYKDGVSVQYLPDFRIPFQNPISHTYTKPGIYYAKLIVYDNYWKSDTAYDTITVTQPQKP
jgi:hypothetical protein